MRNRWPVVIAQLLLTSSLAAQAPDRQPHGFIASRYDTHTSSNIYVGYRLGPVTPMVALVQNPRSDYRESIIGVAHFGSLTPHIGLTYAVAAAKAIDSWYGQLYVLPSFNVGRLESSGQLELYVPLETAGVHQFAINPGNVWLRATPRLNVGGVAVWAEQSNAPYNLGAGPSVQLKIPRGTITVDEVIGITRWDTETRISFFTSY